jgi:4-hydroxybenzoate polyprenyltransferase
MMDLKRALTSFWYLNRMGRPEGPIMGGLLVLVGGLLASGRIDPKTLMAGVALTTITLNFVYQVNAVTDLEEDRINSPNRPLVRGVITVRAANIYVSILFALSVIYPFWLHPTWSQRAIVWTLLALGFFYSLPPVRFKRWPMLATLYLVVNFNLPLVLGHQMSGGEGALPPYLPATALLYLANMPLKDLRDSGGDKAAGVGNWADWLGQTRLLALCSGLSVAGAIAATLLLPHMGMARFAFAAVVLLPAVNIAVHVIFRIDRYDLFTRGVRTLIAICAGVVIVGSLR